MANLTARKSKSLDPIENAVDQLEALAKSDTLARTYSNAGTVTIHFGTQDTEHSAHQVRFNFKPPEPSRTWPDTKRQSFFLRNKSAPTLTKGYKNWKEWKVFQQALSSSDLTVTELGEYEKIFQPLPPEVFKAVKPQRKSDKSGQKDNATSSTKLKKLAPRNPPLTLLTLPPEIRNQIWSILVISNTPLTAELRPIRPCPRLGRGNKMLIRRLPLEPQLSRVNHQLYREVLSVFYGCNHFIFEHLQYACAKLTDKPAAPANTRVKPTTPAIMKAWRPRAEFADDLGSLTIKFGTHRDEGGDYVVHGCMAFRMQKVHTSDGGRQEVEIKVTAERRRTGIVEANICVCEEKDVARIVSDRVRHTVGWGEEIGDLVELASSLTAEREARQVGYGYDRSLPKVMKLGRAFCEPCGLRVMKYRPLNW